MLISECVLNVNRYESVKGTLHFLIYANAIFESSNIKK